MFTRTRRILILIAFLEIKFNVTNLITLVLHEQDAFS